jgi:hypothetical protein
MWDFFDLTKACRHLYEGYLPNVNSVCESYSATHYI